MREIIGNQVDHLARLVDDLLDATRVTHGLVQLRMESTDLLTVLFQAVDPLRPIFADHQLNLSVSTGPGPFRLNADPVRLQQVLANLLSNALKYTEPGGSVFVEAARQGQDLVVTVRDDGIGIAPEMLPRIFDMFAQADSSLDRSRGGLGIGLTLAHILVQKHGGSLTAMSPGLGRGSEFVVRLPALAETLGSGAPTTRTDCHAMHHDSPERPPILVVDDNVDAAHSLSVLLRLWGHTSHVVHDGPEAIEAARQIRPQIVLLDIGLPKLDGYQVARAIRSEPTLAGAKIVAMTGYGQAEDRRKSREAGFDVHLVKPVDLQELEAILGS
jgi:two-component system CheB/CheR fusion protein